MTKQPFKYFEDRVLMTNNNVIDIYHGEVFTPNDQYPFYQIRTGQDLRGMLDHFKANCFGDFTAFIRGGERNARRTGERIYFANFQQSQPQSINGNAIPYQSQSPQYNEQELRAKILAELDADRQKNALIDEVKQLRQLYQEMQKPEERLSRILERLAVNFGWIKDFSAPALQGTQPINQDITMSDEQRAAKLEASLSIIVDAFGEDDLHRIAARIQNDPKIVQTLKNFL